MLSREQCVIDHEREITVGSDHGGGRHGVDDGAPSCSGYWFRRR
jgi:hypothetical protein